MSEPIFVRIKVVPEERPYAPGCWIEFELTDAEKQLFDSASGFEGRAAALAMRVPVGHFIAAYEKV